MLSLFKSHKCVLINLANSQIVLYPGESYTSKLGIEIVRGGERRVCGLQEVQGSSEKIVSRDGQ